MEKEVSVNGSQAKEVNYISTLLDDAKQLLIEASLDSRGQIRNMTFGDGLRIHTHNIQFVEEGNARSEARWKSALEQLVNQDPIEYHGYKGEVFVLTDEGYRVADYLKGVDEK